MNMMDREIISWLWKKTAPQHKLFYLLVCIDITIAILGVVFAMLVRQLIDTAIAGESFISSAGYLVLTVTAQYGLHAIQQYLSEAADTRLTNYLRSEIIHNLVHADYEETMNHHTGEWMNQLFSDVKIVSAGFVGILPDSSGMIARLIFACGALLFLEPMFFIAYFAIGIILIVIVSLLKKRVKVLHKDVQIKEDRVHAFLQELLENILIIKSFHVYDYLERKAVDYQEMYRDARLKKKIVSVLAGISFNFLFRLGYLAALIWGGYGLYEGTLSYGSLMAILQLVMQVRLPVSRLSGVLTRVYETIASCERIQLIAQPVHKNFELKEPQDFCKIVFNDVSFHYDRDQVLDHLNLSVHKGEKVALIGTSGGGKSTLFLLMMGILKPDSGNVYVMDESGNQIEVKDSCLFAYVPQGNALFSGTIEENITFGKPYDSSKINQAVSLAYADQFIANLPDGIRTELNEGGSGLSEGQMQRIAIARALYCDAPVLLLDEATSALDEKTEAGLLENLGKLSDRTIIIVTHRKAALSICDSVYELSGGSISD